jgi:hypothetical protein
MGCGKTPDLSYLIAPYDRLTLGWIGFLHHSPMQRRGDGGWRRPCWMPAGPAHTPTRSRGRAPENMTCLNSFAEKRRTMAHRDISIT